MDPQLDNPVSQQSSDHHLWIQSAIVSVLFLGPLFYFRDLFWDHTFFRHFDLIDYEYAMRKYFWVLFKNEIFTAFYPDNSLGLSLFANPHYKILYPTNLLFLVFSPPTAFKLDYILHIYIFAAGWVFLLRKLDFSFFIALLVVGLVINTNIFLGSHYRVEIASVAWTGWMSFFIYQMATERKARYLLYTGMSAALIFLGGNPILLPGTALFSVFILLYQFSLNDLIRDGRFIFFSCVSISIFALISLPILYTALDVVPFTVRAFNFDSVVSFLHSEKAVRYLDFFFSGFSKIMDPQPEKADYVFLYWYEDLLIGIVPMIAIFWGARKVSERGIGKIYISTVVLFLLFSLGKNFGLVEYLWGQIEILHKIRYPGKFIRFALLFSIPLMAIGLALLSKRLQSRPKIFYGILFFSLIQLLFTRDSALLAPAEKAYGRKLYFPIVREQVAHPQNKLRVMSCNLSRDPIAQEESVHIDMKVYGVSMVKTGEASETPVVRAASCRWATSPLAKKFFGYTHIIAVDQANVYDELKRNDPFWRATHKVIDSPVYDGFKVPGNSPLKAHFVNDWKIDRFMTIESLGFHDVRSIEAKKGVEDLKRGVPYVSPLHFIDGNGYSRPMDVAALSDIEPSIDKTCLAEKEMDMKTSAVNNFFSFETLGECEGLLVLPWSAIPGWRAKVNGAMVNIYRVADAFIGIKKPKGPVKVELFFEPPQLIWQLGLSVFLQMFIGLLMLGQVGVWITRKFRDEPML